MAHIRLPFRGRHSADTVRSLDIPRHAKVAVLWGKKHEVISSLVYVFSFLIKTIPVNPWEGARHDIYDWREPGCKVTSWIKIRVSTMPVRASECSTGDWVNLFTNNTLLSLHVQVFEENQNPIPGSFSIKLGIASLFLFLTLSWVQIGVSHTSMCWRKFIISFWSCSRTCTIILITNVSILVIRYLYIHQPRPLVCLTN